jgi:prepilin-type N-terminal cleavage/methylation domain-containing protein
MSRLRTARRCSGFTLPEVLITLVLASLVVLGITRLVVTASRTVQLRDSQAEMRERARYALAVLEPEVQMAGYYGLSNRGEDFGWLQAGNAALAVPSAQLQQTSPPLAAAPTAAHDCGSNYVLDLAVALQADNGAFVLGADRTPRCAPSGGARPGSDTLTIRRASTAAAGADPGRLQLLVDRSDERRCWILGDGVLPAGLAVTPDLFEWRDLQLSIYYISNDSVGAPGTPALRVKSLTRVSGRPAFVDTEVVPGVEDMQVRLLTAAGSFDPGTLPLNAEVRMIQLWLRLRASSIETGYRDTQTYRYADVVATPAVAEQGYRRLLVARRIALRNAAP